jgi:hypothetical protein
MTISECDGKLYTLYTKFGSEANPCGDVDVDNNVVNGYLHMSVYDPIYDAWDKGQRVTTTPETPTGCIPGSYTGGAGTCNSEYWGSMARYGRVDPCQFPTENVLDVVFINDQAPGGCVQTESGVWTVNPVIWWVYPCREAVVVPEYSDDAGLGFGLCSGGGIIALAPGGDTSLTVIAENHGLLDNTVSDISTSSSDVNVVVTVTPPTPFDILKGGGSVEMTVDITAGVGATDPSTVTGLITITHDAENSPREIPWCATVSTTYVPLESADISTACKRLRVYNNGELSGDAANSSLDFLDETDCATIYLYDGSPIICRDIDGEKKCFYMVYGQSYADDNSFHQMSPMFVDSINNESYTYATAEFVTADSAIGLIVEYFAPKHSDSCSFMMQKLKFWNRTELFLSAVAVGEALDWDIPSDEEEWDNESGKDEGRNLIYQYCCGNDPCNTLDACGRNGGIAAAMDVGAHPNGFKNYMTLENDVYIYESGPFGSDAPLPPDTIYSLMTGNDGYYLAQLDSCEDLMTLVTFDVYDMLPDDTMCVVKILSTSRFDVGATTLQENIDKANAFIGEHPEIKCSQGPGPCLCLPGDANGDGDINVGDAVYIISYVFKGGAAPTPYNPCSGDANGDCDCNVGDAVYIISYVFKGGADPVTCEFWRDEGGDGTGCGDFE